MVLNRRFGWHSGTLTCKNATIKNDLAIEGDLSFGDAITDTLTCNGLFKMGTNASPLVLTAETPLFTLYTTSASTDGGNSVTPIYMKSIMTGAGGVGGRAEFYMTCTATLGSWANALKGYFEIGTGGSVTGLGSAICAELKMPNASVSGTYTPLEIELVLQASSNTGTATSFICSTVSGTTTAFVDNGYVLDLQGLGSATSGKIFQQNTQTATHALRIRIGSTPYYILLTNTGA